MYVYIIYIVINLIVLLKLLLPSLTVLLKGPLTHSS